MIKLHWQGMTITNQVTVHKRQRTIRRFLSRVLAYRKHAPRSVNQFKNGVKTRVRIIHVDPNHRASSTFKAEEIDITIGCDRTMNLESQSKILITGLFVGSQQTDIFLDTQGCIGVTEATDITLDLRVHSHIPVMAVRIEAQSLPITRLGCTATWTRVFLHASLRSKTSAHTGVIDGGHDDGKARLPNHMHATPDPVNNVKRPTSCFDAATSQNLDHKRLTGTALQTKPTISVMIWNNDSAIKHMDNVGIIPDNCCLQNLSTNLKTIQIIARQTVALNHGSVVCRADFKRPDSANLPTRIILPLVTHRVGIDADRSTVVIHKDIVDQCGLSGIHINRRIPLRGVTCSSISLCRTGSWCIVFKTCVGDPGGCLMDLHGIE